MFNDGPKLTWFGAVAIASGIGFFLLIEYKIAPWVIETVCRELLRCTA